MDRRSFPRIDVDLWVEQESGEETVFRLAGNLSAGGLYLEHGFTYSVGTRVKLRFVLEEDSPAVEVAAEIVSAVQTEAAPNAASLSFLDLTGEDRARILTFLNAKMSEG
ncbi:MAG: PilZ domain-containing protein [Myxococcota bacterium]